ncbi:tRNA (uracil-5-)-methyltransferase A-like [Homarus americanus]|uniref:tRNA (uracil(54)-C(5))-methyltransferase n=1 Tax=Homarus americanus TaxID=6706 RepID=A0A8J5KFF4_HOMAM|nr:tRNA (uracil-5-)-methyltransferase A-like [Homarus americanus]
MEEAMEENDVQEMQGEPVDVAIEKEVIIVEDELSMEHDGEEGDDLTQQSKDDANGKEGDAITQHSEDDTNGKEGDAITQQSDDDTNGKEGDAITQQSEDDTNGKEGDAITQHSEDDTNGKEGDAITQQSDDDTNGEDKSEESVTENQKEESSKDASDPYAYTKRDEFTSENFKIELKGLPRYYSVGQLKKLVNDTLQLKAHKIKPAGYGNNWVYINFRDQKAREKALVVLDDYEWKKCRFKVSNASPVADPLIKRTEKEVSKKKEKKVEIDPDANLSIEEKVLKSVLPYAHLSYDEQLKLKEKEARQVMRKYGTELARVNPELVEWVHWQKLRRGGQICEMDDIIPSPVTDGYRNKCEFSIGINPDNNLPTVGFRIASYKEGSMHVAPVNHLCHLPDQMKRVVTVFLAATATMATPPTAVGTPLPAQPSRRVKSMTLALKNEEFEKFVRDSGRAPFSPLTHEGFWRQLNIRTTRNKDILIIPMGEGTEEYQGCSVQPQGAYWDKIAEATLRSGSKKLLNVGGGAITEALLLQEGVDFEGFKVEEAPTLFRDSGDTSVTKEDVEENQDETAYDWGLLTHGLNSSPQIHPQEMNKEEQEELKKKIVDHFTEGPGKSFGVTSIFFKAYGQKEQGEEIELEHLWGTEYITETILDKKFRVSPDAFLQVNTAAAEVLYNKLGSVADLDGTSALLDICCGTGTIGISLADRCLKVYGIEVVEKAADDARHNAEENGLENIVILTGKAEENMQVLVQSCNKVNVVGIVDPPRAGLNGNVVFGLRKCENMKHLLFVSCDPNCAFKNFINLGRPQSKQYKGEFFIPLKAIPVDLFPHTPHYELIILFERWEERKWRRIMEGNPLPRDDEYFQRVPKRPRAAQKFSPTQVSFPLL